MSVGRGEGRLRCPEGKRELLRAALAEMRVALKEEHTVPWREARSAVGKLANLAQVLPELRLVLRGGYAVTRPAGGATGRGWRRADNQLRLRPGSRAAQDWATALDVSESLLRDNEGVPLAPRKHFAGMHEPGSVVVTTDASGVDGVGGYSFIRDAEGGTTAWLVSEAWPADALDALHRNAATKAERAAAATSAGQDPAPPLLSMPTAELFGTWAVVEAVAAATALTPGAVIAVGDCDPAAAA
eukprot:1861276-Pleurochrysis_carterae.AAC.1